MKITLPLIILLSLTFSRPCFALTDEEHYTAIIDNFTQALQGQDDDAVVAAWDQINADPQAKEYMETHDPLAASNFRMTQTIIGSMQALERFKLNYPGPVSFPQMPQRPEFTHRLTNQSWVLAYPNNEQPTIQEVHEQQMNAPLPNNQTTVKNLPNQNRRSNQDYIRSELNRMLPESQ